MALHSKFNSGFEKIACGISIAPIKTTVPGPAPKPLAGDTEDIVDEALKYFRPNLLFKNFSVNGAGDVTLIYLTVFITKCLQLVANETSEIDARKKLLDLAREAIPLPGAKSFFMGAQVKESKDSGEIGGRAPEFKFWMGLSKRKFMGLSYN